MRCPSERQESSEILLAYCAGRLDRDSAQMLERHMAGCDACRRFREAQQTVWEALENWESPAISADFNRRLYQRIGDEERTAWWQRWLDPLRAGMTRHLVPLTAAACLLLTASVILERPRHTPQPSSQIRAEAVQTEQLESTLDDLEMLHDITVAQHPSAGEPAPM